MSNNSTEVLTGFINWEGTVDLAQRISVMWEGENPDRKVLLKDCKWGSRDSR